MTMLHPIWKRAYPHHLPVPSRATAGAAGFDLAWSGAQPEINAICCPLLPGETQRLGTGWQVQIPPGYVGLIRDRSSFAARGLTTRAGVIDSDYRGEIIVLLRNEGTNWAEIKPGERIAQIVFVPCLMTDSHQASELDTTTRGADGFGSTGT